jgi:hypothetical protein
MSDAPAEGARKNLGTELVLDEAKTSLTPAALTARVLTLGACLIASGHTKITGMR